MPHPYLSPQTLRLLALALWLLSLVLPSIYVADGSTATGFHLLLSSIAWLPVALPLLPGSAVGLVSLGTNLLMVSALRRALRPGSETRTPAWVLPLALLANVCVASSWYYRTEPWLPLNGLLSLPGYYCWLGGFVALWAAELWESPPLISWWRGLARRLGGLTLLVAGVVALGLFAILLLRPA
jgi:hypothetical protein